MRASLLGITVSVLLSAPAMADDRASVLILDASGSMWTQLDDGTSRIEVARDVLGDFLSARDPLQPLGIIAYGHNRRGDCTDIEVLSEVGQQDPAPLALRLRGLNPQGKTPLADALRMAATQIPRTSEEADIVLVTDGLETCGGDPCAVAAELAGMGIPVRAHVVGFGLSESEIAQISCVAETTGGLVLSTQSGAELANALARTIDAEPVVKEPVVEPEPAALIAPPEAEARSMIPVSWTLPANLPPAAGETDRLWWAMAERPNNSGHSAADVDPATGTAELQVPATEGDWFLVYNRWFADGHSYREVARAAVRVTPVEFLVAGPPQVDAGSRFYVDWSGQVMGEDRLVVMPADTPRTNSPVRAADIEGERGTAIMTAPAHAGAYEVRRHVTSVQGITVGARYSVDVVPPTIEIVMPEQVQAGEEFDFTYRGPAGADTWLDMTVPGETKVWGRGYSFGSSEYARDLKEDGDLRRGSLRAPEKPGQYTMRVVLSVEDRVPVYWHAFEVVESVPEGQGLYLDERGYEINSDRPGSDIASTPLPTPDPTSCEAICGANLECKAWTYVQPGVQGSEAVCWTKHSVPEARQSDCCISGVMADLAQRGAADQAMTPADEAALEPSLGEDIAYRCDQAICMITDTPSGLSFALPQGWMTDVPTLEAYTAGGESGTPRVTFVREANGAVDTIVLNPRQWSMFNGPCMDVPMGQLCQFEGEGADPDVAALLGQTLRWEAPAEQDADAGHGPDTDPLHDQAAYVCEAEMFGCVYEDDALQYLVMVPPGWSMTEPTRAPEPADDGRNPLRMTFFSKMEVPDRIVLNPEAWSEADGPCLSLQAGSLCHSASGSDMLAPALDTLRRTLRDTAPRRLPTPEEALAKVMADLATDDPDAAAAMGALLGTAQDLNTADGQAPDAGEMMGAVIGTLLNGQDPRALPPPDSAASSGVVLRSCSNDAPCTFEQPDLVISGALPAGWSVEMAVQRPDLRISTWFTHLDPAGNTKRLGLNQPGNDNCVDTALGRLCHYTPYISTQEENLIARSLGYGMASDVPARLAQSLGEAHPMDAQSMDGLLQFLDWN